MPLLAVEFVPQQIPCNLGDVTGDSAVDFLIEKKIIYSIEFQNWLPFKNSFVFKVKGSSVLTEPVHEGKDQRFMVRLPNLCWLNSVRSDTNTNIYWKKRNKFLQFKIRSKFLPGTQKTLRIFGVELLNVNFVCFIHSSWQSPGSS